MAQGANDNHRIVESLRTIYSGAFVGTGWSRGGMTAIFHEFFFPEDLDVVVPMVAPISFGPLDQRYPVALAELGPQECRDKLDQTRLGALERLEELVDSVNPEDEDERDFQLNWIRQDIIAFDWTFWQFHGFAKCDSIPSPTAPAEELLAMYQQAKFPTPRNFFRPLEEGEDRVIAHTYHSITELGYPADFPAGLLDRLEEMGHLPAEEREFYELPLDERGLDVPWDEFELPAFDEQAMRNVDTWLKNDARDVLAVYGEYDPWTAGKVTLNESLNSRVYISQKANHAATLAELKPEDFEDLKRRLFERLDIKPLTNAYVHREISFDKERLTEMLKKGSL